MIQAVFLTLLLGSVLTALTSGWRKVCGWVAVLTLLATAGMLTATAFCVFQGTEPLQFSEPFFSLPFIGAHLTFSIDRLGALFLFLIGIITLLATLYSVGYMELYPKESPGRFYTFLLLFVAGMVGVVAVSDLFFFLVFWEIMTLMSYFLVIYEKDDPVALKAGFKYFLMTHIATVFMIIAAVALFVIGGSFSFSAIGGTLALLAVQKPLLLSVLLACFFIGFATKAGVYPFGTWLPDAHPAAPSGVSAILSGVMIKMGVYGILRIFVFLLPVTFSSVLWGGVIALFGTISLVLGASLALMQKDSKRLLAYSSISQIGYMLLAIGMGIALLKDAPALAALALMAGLFHLVNHAFFKSLLFLNAGSILFKAGSRDLNHLGGLWAVMPLTGLTCVVASLSIAGLPPFNGFASKWLIYQVTVLGGVKQPIYLLFGVLAIFISAVTLAYFVKFLSTTFFGEMPGALKNKVAPGEVPGSMLLPQILLAAFCLLLGLFPLIPLHLIFSSLSGARPEVLFPSFVELFGGGRNGVVLVIQGMSAGVLRPLWVSLVFLLCLVVSWLIFKAGGSRIRKVPVWLCGEEYPPEIVRYQAQSFYLPIVSLMEKWLAFPSFKMWKAPDWIYKVLDLDRIIYYPLARWLIDITGRFRKTHVGIPQVYMLWQILGILVVILVLFLLAR